MGHSRHPTKVTALLLQWATGDEAGRFESVRITTQPFAFGNAVIVPKRLQMGPPGSTTNYDITPDGWIVGLITAGQKEHVRGSDNAIEVVLNWFEILKARVPQR